jgi:hypothetical protein
MDGTVRQLLECTSRFGGIPLPIFSGRAVGCLQGEKMVGNAWIPLTVKIYIAHKNGYQLAGEVPFDRLYEKLGQFQKEALAQSIGRPAGAKG